MRNIFATAILGAALAAGRQTTGTVWSEDGNVLRDSSIDVTLASNKVAGQWILDRQAMAGWFLKPVTLWDGCDKRKFLESSAIGKITSSSTGTFVPDGTSPGSIWQIRQKKGETS